MNFFSTILINLKSLILFNECIADSYQFGFLDPVTPIAEGIIDVHHHVFFYMIIVFIFVS